MSSRQGWLLNNITPSLVNSDGFDVRAGVVRIFCANLGGNVPLLQWVGSTDNGVWVPVFRCGSEIQLSDTNNSYVEFIPGKYTIDPTNASSNAMIWFEEGFATSGDDRTKWVYVISNCSCTPAPAPAPPPPSCTYYDVTNPNGIYVRLFNNAGGYVWGSEWVNSNDYFGTIGDPSVLPTQGFSNPDSGYPTINNIRITVDVTGVTQSVDLYLSNNTSIVPDGAPIGNLITFTLNGSETTQLLLGSWAPEYMDQFGYVYFAPVSKIEVCTQTQPPFQS